NIFYRRRNVGVSAGGGLVEKPASACCWQIGIGNIGNWKLEIGNRQFPMRVPKQVEATHEPTDGPPHRGPLLPPREGTYLASRTLPGSFVGNFVGNFVEPC